MKHGKNISRKVIAGGIVLISIAGLVYLSLCKEKTDKSPTILNADVNEPEKIPIASGNFQFPGQPPKFAFDGPFPKMPDRIMVYKVVPPENVNEDYVREMAQKYFGVPSSSELKRSSNLGLYWLKTASDRFQFDPHNGFFDIMRIREARGAWSRSRDDYPTEDDCIRIATDYLRKRELLSDDIQFSSVSKKPSNGMLTVTFRRIIDGLKSWDYTIMVGIDQKGEIIEVRNRYQKLVPYRKYPIKTPQEAFDELVKGKALILGFGGKVTRITLRYDTGLGDAEYVHPVYFFDYTAPDGHYYAAVPAIKDEHLRPQEMTIRQIQTKSTIQSDQANEPKMDSRAGN